LFRNPPKNARKNRKAERARERKEEEEEGGGGRRSSEEKRMSLVRSIERIRTVAVVVLLNNRTG
jgi:hypothetical protein